MNDRERFLEVLDRARNLPYLWGGDDPMSGYDCSGLVVEGLKSVGLLPNGADATADDLWRKYRGKEVPLGVARETPGCLYFYLDSTGKATHIEVSIGEGRVLGAIGGGAKTFTVGDAKASNAYVKIRPVNYRGGPDKAVDPWG